MPAGDGLAGVEPIFGNTDVTTAFTGDKVKIFLVRPKSFAAEESGGAAAAVEELSVPDTGATGTAVITNRFVEEKTGPSLDDADIVVSGGRGLGEQTGFEMIETLAKRLGGSRRLPRHRRRRLGALLLPGRSDRQIREAQRVHRGGRLGRHPAPGGHEGLQVHRAINKDAEAPIFSVADLGIVGDVHKVRKLIEALQSR